MCGRRPRPVQDFTNGRFHVSVRIPRLPNAVGQAELDVVPVRAWCSRGHSIRRRPRLCPEGHEEGILGTAIAGIHRARGDPAGKWQAITFGKHGTRMSDRSRPQRRVSRHAAVGRTHGRAAVARMGVALRDARRSAGLKQSDVAARAGVTQSTISRLELGLGATATIDTWARVVAGVGQQLAVFIERASGADRPRDFEHLRRQQLVIAAALAGGWVAKLEVAVDPAVQRSRSIDVVLASGVRPGVNP